MRLNSLAVSIRRWSVSYVVLVLVLAVEFELAPGPFHGVPAAENGHERPDGGSLAEDARVNDRV